MLFTEEHRWLMGYGWAAHFLTVLSPHELDCRREGDALTVTTPLGVRTISLSKGIPAPAAK